MDQELWQRLSTRSKRAIMRTHTRAYSGKRVQPYRYNPRGDLLRNLSKEYNQDMTTVYHRLLKLRKDVLREHGLDKIEGVR